MVKNYAEVLVYNTIHSAIKSDPNLLPCTCDECIDSVAALMLNKTKPFYTTRKIGEIYAEFEAKDVQNVVAMATQLALAVKTLNEHPNHQN